MRTLGKHIGVRSLKHLVSRFLYDQTHPNPLLDESPTPPLPTLHGPIRVFHSAAATFFAPSDISGVGGMRREHIRATPRWRKGLPRYDCVFAEKDSSLDGFRGLHAARVLLLFSFTCGGVSYPCALVRWFSPIADEPDDLTGMWVVEPDFNGDGSPSFGIMHLDAVLRAAHLLPVFGDAFLPANFHFSQSLDSYKSFYVNKFVDHHAHEIAF